MLFIVRRKSIVKALAAYCGGNWTYAPDIHQWICDDGRYVCRVACSLHDDVCNCQPRYCLYSNDQTPQWIYFIFA